MNILLARWMSPTQYGAFAIAFALLLIVSGPHSALFIDPLAVVGPRYFGNRHRAYIRTLLMVHAVLMVPFAALIAAYGLLPGSLIPVPSAYLGAICLAVPLVLLLWLLRGACYLEMRPGVALRGSAVYGIVLVGLAVWGHVASWLTAATALQLMAVASVAASAGIVVELGIFTDSATAVAVPDLVREHWLYGRWILGASAANAIAYGLYVPLVGTLVGLEQTAVFRALQNLILPLDRILGGIAMVAYPAMSQRVARQGTRYLTRRGPAFVMAGVGIAAVYGLMIAVFGRALLSVLYGTAIYSRYASLTGVIAVAAVLTALAQFLGILVRVVNQPQAVLWSKTLAAAWLAGFGAALVRAAGVRGAILAIIGGTLAEALLLTAAFARIISHRPDPNP